MWVFLPLEAPSFKCASAARIKLSSIVCELIAYASKISLPLSPDQGNGNWSSQANQSLSAQFPRARHMNTGLLMEMVPTRGGGEC